MLTTLVCLVIPLASLLQYSAADVPENCINLPGNPRVEFETQLMDSWTHDVLLLEDPPRPGHVWSEVSLDDNDDPSDTTNPTSWEPITATSPCRRHVKVCGWGRGRQDNWLFTQHISQGDFDPNIYNYPVQVHVDINFGISNCKGRDGCRRGFELYKYQTNTTQSSSTERQGFKNYRNYNLFANETIPGSTSTSPRRNYSFTLPPSSTGFYIAVRDTGSCLTLFRIRVYRNNCQSFQTGLVLYPDAPAPVSGSENIDVGCVENAEVSGSSKVTCSSDGVWGPQSPVCHCKPGYVTNTTACNACPAGTFRSGEHTECQDCPANTMSPRGAAPLCECSDGYFRNNENRTHPDAFRFVNQPTETASNDCTKPPSAPRSVSLTPQQNSITVRWSAPADRGGRSDLYYQIEISDPDNLGSYTGTVYLSGSSTSRTLSNLRPYTQYCVRVTAHNGVSDQDPDREHLRREEECTRTLEAEPGPVRDLISIYPLVSWQEPLRPNGVIKNYELTFTRNGVTKTVVSLQTFFITSEESLPEGSGSFTVQVKAINTARSGESVCELTVNPGMCSTQPQRCTVCEEKTVGLAHYPTTTAPQGEGSIDMVTVECVENAVPLSPSLEVTCSSDGVWGSETPECKCMESYIEEAGTCTGGLSKTTDTVCEFPLAAVLITFAATAVAIGLLATVVLILVVVGFKRKLKTIASTSSQGDGNSYYMQPVKAGL